MRLFFSKHELKLRRKRTIAAIMCMVVVLVVPLPLLKQMIMLLS